MKKSSNRYRDKKSDEKIYTKDDLLKNKDEYERLVDARIQGLIETEGFVKKEQQLDSLGYKIRVSLYGCIDGLGAVYCYECGRFFEYPKCNKEGFEKCKKHRGLRRSYAIEHL